MSDELEQDDTDVFESINSGYETETDNRWVELPAADMLTLQEADELLRWRAASIIAIVGERNGGKTTLVSELYERFLRGPFADTFFSHSLSLLGFERKTFQSRAESGADKPDTPRTSTQDGLRFFHLAVSDYALRRSDLLISERAGETYREVRDRPEGAHEILEVRKARAVVFILDGERVANPLQRAEAFASVRHLIRAFVQSNTISRQCEIQVVTTKWDLLTSPESLTATNALAEFESRIIATYTPSSAKISVFRIAARDPLGKLEPGFGLSALFKSWLEPAPQIPIAPRNNLTLADEFDRLLVRRLG